jgi:hypothetical protein
VWGCGLHSFGLRHRPVAGSCEHGNETSGYIKEGKSVDWLINYKLLKRDSAAWSYCILSLLLVGFHLLASYYCVLLQSNSTCLEANPSVFRQAKVHFVSLLSWVTTSAIRTLYHALRWQIVARSNGVVWRGVAWHLPLILCIPRCRVGTQTGSSTTALCDYRSVLTSRQWPAVLTQVLHAFPQFP